MHLARNMGASVAHSLRWRVLSRQVMNEQERAGDEIQQMLITKDCQILVASHEPYVRNAANLRLLARGQDAPIPRDSR